MYEKFINYLQQKLYKNQPVIIQNLGISFYGLYWYNHRFGKIFKRKVEEFRNREYYTEDQWEAYQTLHLRKLLVHSYNFVPYYQELFNNNGFKLIDLIHFELKDLKHIPFLEKQTLRDLCMSSMLSTKLNPGTFISTSGSTGTPIKVYLPKYFHQIWSALMETRVRNWAGVSYKAPRGMIGGRRILPTSDVKFPLYRYNYIEKQTYFSAYHLSRATVANYIEGIRRNKVEYLTGYAVSIFLMAKYALEENLNIPKLKAVITSSEKLTKEMRLTISEAFQCKVYDSYSGCEACGLISETPEGDLVFNPDSGILELIDYNGNQVSKGQTGEIVLTGFYNYDQPLIRYRIGDYATLDLHEGPIHGRYMPKIQDILGRVEDIVYGRDGRAMVRFHSVFYDIPGLKMAQIIQEEIDFIRVSLIIDSINYNKEYAENIIKERIFSQLGYVTIEFLYPFDLIRTAVGKVKAVISNLKK